MKKETRFGIAIIPLILAVLACNFSATTANISSATLARDSEGAQPTTTFAPEDTFYVIVELSNAPDDTKVKSVWTAVEVTGVDPDLLIDDAELTSGSGTLTFNLSSENLWPSGKYKVDLYIEDKLERTLEFEVQE